jgi:hypothetical protein
MSMTKQFYHDVISADAGFPDAAEFYFSLLSGEPEDELARLMDEQAAEMFADRRIDYDAYEEFDCPLCYQPNTTDDCHNECHNEEKMWAELASRYLPHHAI